MKLSLRFCFTHPTIMVRCVIQGCKIQFADWDDHEACYEHRVCGATASFASTKRGPPCSVCERWSEDKWSKFEIVDKLSLREIPLLLFYLMARSRRRKFSANLLMVRIPIFRRMYLRVRNLLSLCL